MIIAALESPFSSQLDLENNYNKNQLLRCFQNK